MAKAFVVAPQQSHNHLNQILCTQLIRKRNHLEGIILSSPWTRIFSSIFNSDYCSGFSFYCKNSNIVNVHIGRFASVSVTSLPSLPAPPHPLRSCRRCLRFPSLPLLPLCRSRSPHLRVFLMSHTDGPSILQDSTKTVTCVMKGRVQGVFYRDWTVENATKLGLKGWVRNRRGGSVEALFSGKAEVVDEMLQRCRRGPPDAMVTALEANPCNEDPGVCFERRPTV